MTKLYISRLSFKRASRYVSRHVRYWQLGNIKMMKGTRYPKLLKNMKIM